MQKVFVAASLLLFFTLRLTAQLFPLPNYPHDYFRNPLAVPISLAANFGELRPNHYHMGLDIRTQHRENLPVYAAADGWVARVQIEPAGFGQAIYINHPNGYTTVYGHLNQFFPALAAYVGEQQYKRESWQVNLEIPPSLFPVKKGDLIAYSGNTGGSQGPHLHFEIRRTAGDVNQNPLLFNLPVPDNTSPGFVRLAWYDRNQGIYEQSPHILPVHKTTAAALSKIAEVSATTPWTIAPTLLTVSSNRISLAISAFDTQSGSANPNGIYEATLYKDAAPVVAFQMNNISYENTRNLNAHIDYRTRALGGPFLQHLSLLPGYPAPTIYAAPAGSPASGVLDLSDKKTHDIRIEIKDTYGNSSTLFFQLKYSAAAASPVPVTPPDAIAKRFYPGMVDGIETEDCAFYLGERSLYDSVTIATTVAGYPGAGVSLPGAVSAAHTIGGVWIPLLQPVLVRLLPRSPAAGTDSIHKHSWSAASTMGIVMVRTQGTQKEVQLPEWQNGWASARFREFGTFQLVEDKTPPVITPLQPLEGADLSKAPRIAFSIKDNLGALRNFRAELDGAWLCFTNDKGLAYIYKFDEHCPAGAHTLKVSVEDVAGNKTVREYHFTR
ncbi:MAG: M23 family metallopeptidase [Bacteroidetes bacterium]|nr:M23 family metallopeptidase [Bacteroidota bacterium]